MIAGDERDETRVRDTAQRRSHDEGWGCSCERFVCLFEEYVASLLIREYRWQLNGRVEGVATVLPFRMFCVSACLVLLALAVKRRRTQL